MSICAFINRITNDWRPHNWGIAGAVGGTVLAIATLPATIPGAVAGVIVTGGGGLIGTGIGSAKEVSNGKEEVLELFRRVSAAATNFLTVSQEVVQQWNGIVQYSAWTALSGGVSALSKWHEYQYCADEDLDFVCTPVRVVTATLFASSVGCTVFLFGKINAYQQKLDDKNVAAKKQQQAEEDLRQAQIRLENSKKREFCAIM